MSRRTTDLLWFFVGGLIVGLLLASERPTPPRGAKRSNVPDTGEIEQIARKLGYRKAAGQ